MNLIGKLLIRFITIFWIIW